MRRIKLTRAEQEIENDLVKGAYVNVSKADFDEVARSLAHRRKNAILNIRMNSSDLQTLKQKAKRHGIKYQTFIAELLHRVAHS